ncbi:MAG TPA: hypothetical protein VH163_07360, partial [Gemmatimonadales bacterium]|nr:hypothetical protein [Gemmatimonadales bacterium]
SGFYMVSNPADTTFQIESWTPQGPACVGEATVQSYDTLGHTFAGTFQYTVTRSSPSLSDTVRVTQGRFSGTYLR